MYEYTLYLLKYICICISRKTIQFSYEGIIIGAVEPVRTVHVCV